MLLSVTSRRSIARWCSKPPGSHPTTTATLLSLFTSLRGDTTTARRASRSFRNHSESSSPSPSPKSSPPSGVPPIRPLPTKEIEDAPPPPSTIEPSSSYRTYYPQVKNWPNGSTGEPANFRLSPSTKIHRVRQRRRNTKKQRLPPSSLIRKVMSSPVEFAKRAAAFQAVRKHLDPNSHTLVGIGSGSTVVHVVDAIAEALPSSATDKMTFVPTGEQSKDLIIKAGLRLGSISSRPLDRKDGGGSPQMLDIAFDGADEVDPELNLIKGGGACLWQEKFVACAAKKFVCVADYRKISPRLGTAWKKGIPIEVHPLAAADVLRELREIGSKDPQIRQGGGSKAGPVVTDNGMWLIDAPFEPLLVAGELGGEVKGMGENGRWEVGNLAAKLKSLLGVVEVGLFYGMNGIQAQASGLGRAGQKPVAAYFGMEDGSVKVQEA